MRKIDLVKTLSSELETLGTLDTACPVLSARVKCRDDRDTLCIVINNSAFLSLLKIDWFITKVEPADKIKDIKSGLLGELFRLPLVSSMYLHPEVQMSLPSLADNMMYLGRVIYKGEL